MQYKFNKNSLDFTHSNLSNCTLSVHQELQVHASDLDIYTPATEKLNSEPVEEVDRNPVTETEPQVPSLSTSGSYSSSS